MGVGAAVGILIALVLTFAFPDSEEFSQSQVLGFLALIGVVVFGAIGALVALIFDRVGSRHAATVVAGRVHVVPPGEDNGVADPGADPAADPGADPGTDPRADGSTNPAASGGASPHIAGVEPAADPGATPARDGK